MIPAALVAFAVSVLVVRLLLTDRVAAVFLDHPNERSLHARPVPRTGGLGLVTGVCCALALFVPGSGVLLLAILLLAAVSLIDDWRSLPAWVRLLAHLSVSAAFLWVALPGVSPLALLPLALATGWVTNLYNFMDGMDGLAGGMGVFGFTAYGVAAWLAGDSFIASCSLAVAAASLGFLLFNFPPARVFMGDAGSIPLGFLAGAVGLAGWNRGLWPLWFPLVVFAPFVVDASVTLARRALRRERLWQAHRSHYYQRVVLMGWSHRRTVLLEYALMFAGGTAALLAVRLDAPAQLLALGPLAVVYAAAMISVDRRWRARQEL